MEGKKKSKIGLGILIGVLVMLSVGLVGFQLYEKLLKNNDSNTNEITNIPKSQYRMTGNSLEKFDLAFLQLNNAKTNKVYSPLSIKYALGMLSEGSKGTTKAQIESVVGDYTAKKYTNNSNMSFANAMFIRNTYKNNINKTYIDNLSNKYNAEVVYDAFNNANKINNWVSDKTFNLVENLYTDETVEELDFALINALAIDMEWVNKIQKEYEVYSVKYEHENYSMYVSPLASGYVSLDFDDAKQNAKSVTIGASINKYDIINTLGEDNIRQEVKAAYEEYLREDPCGSASTELDVDTFLEQYMQEIGANYNQISSSTDFEFYQDDEVTVFAKDLQEYNGTTLQYVGIMPKNIKLEQYIKNIDAQNINDIINNLKGFSLENFDEGTITDIKGYIPMFKFEYELDLMADLKSLGMTDVFNSKKADISALTTAKNAYIGDATHKANIEFSNDGIKAAAATIEGGLGDAYCGFEYNYDVPVKEINLTFDNPYLFLIRDKNSGEVWFTGTVYEPITQ